MRDFSDCRRIVVKIGTNLLIRDNRLDLRQIEAMAAQIASLRADDRQVLLVTSGAVGMGAHELRLKSPPQSMRKRQACAAIGQPLLMRAYRDVFAAWNITVAQVLLTNEVLDRRISYLNLRWAVEELLSLRVLPIFNENDSVSVAELDTAFGDNDRLSALISAKIDAELLIILSDVDAIYSADPHRDLDAVPLRTIEVIDDAMIASAGTKGSAYSLGGMASKLKAARIAGLVVRGVIIAHGGEPEILPRLLAGEEVGSWIPSRSHLRSRKRWIMNATPRGRIWIDRGAMRAIHGNKSLLPTGLVAVEGLFGAGEVIDVCLPRSSDIGARLISGLSSHELRRVIGAHSSQVPELLGRGKRGLIARPEDIVPLGDHDRDHSD